MYPLLIKILLINLVASLLLIDTRTFGFLSRLLYTDSGAKFLMMGYKMEYDIKTNMLDLICIRLLILLYLIFSLPINAVYVALTGHRYAAPWYTQLYNLAINPLIAPPLECSWLNGMNAAFNDHALFLRLQDKIYWNDLFETHGAPTPKIVGSISNGTITKNRFYSSTGSYISKPRVGGLGNGITVFNERQPPNQGEFIIQERVTQPGTRGHFRIVTAYNGENYAVVSTYMCLNGKDKLASNNHAGGRCHDVDLTKGTVRYLLDTNKEQTSKFFSVTLLKQAIAKATELHKSLPLYIISVGWDVMLTEKEFFFLEGNVPCGTVMSNDRLYYEKAIPINKVIYGSVFNR